VGTLKIILDILHDGYERVIAFLRECKKVLEELGPLLFEILILGIPLLLLLWIVYEIAEYFKAGAGAIVVIIVAAPTLGLFVREILRRKPPKEASPSDTETDSGWSLKKAAIVGISYLLLIAVGSAMHVYNISSRERDTANQRQNERDKSLAQRPQNNPENANTGGNKNVSTPKTENKNISRPRIAENKDEEEGRTAPNPLPTDSPSDVWGEIDSAFESNKVVRIKQYLNLTKRVGWSLVLSNEICDHDNDICTIYLHEDAYDFDSKQSYPVVVARVKLSDYPVIVRMHKGENTIVYITGKILAIVEPGQGSTPRPEIILDNAKLPYLFRQK